MKGLSRRDFIKSSLAGVGAATVSLSLVGCSHNDSSPSYNDFAVDFNHGVASGDPLSDRVILWTRVTPEGTPKSVNVSLEVSLDKTFENLEFNESLAALAKNDYTIKVDLEGLKANTRYYYRFKTNDNPSPMGETKTLPETDVKQVKFAVMSCANYPAGYFHAYAEAAKMQDLDAVLHLGDYIYEYGMGGYATDKATELGRMLPEDNQGELISLADYRKRYALYRTDTGLQALHAKTPFIAVWDDHEVCNDAYLDGAENHNDDEGMFTDRKMAALKAYYEWMPIRPYVTGQAESLYRKFDFGGLVSLYMLDTRHEARVKPLDYQNYFDPTSGQFDAASFQADLTSPTQQLIGTEQLTWLTDNIKTSESKWQVLGQQVLMTKMMLPAELLVAMANPSAEIASQMTELAQLKARAQASDPTLSEQDKIRIGFTAPYNLDAWDGYPVEREMLLQTAKAANKNLVTIAGDTHNAWSGKLCTAQGDVCGYEFATPSVSSPGLEYYLQLPESQASEFAKVLELLVDDLEFANIHQRGFMTLTFTPDNVDSQWHFISNVQSQVFGIENKTLIQKRL
ncbi:MAG: alkaline phosphatase [Pseudoalteromonas sp.]|nr:alkaline phosphatase [Pseudoalteromonas sp.]|tara:strand:+ start:1946 stop:3652 length:1707 start_codon:yes stop_codon:yes gene_type:complete